jgi:glycosyltransferase involved in cell wall biosynthesis
VDCFDVVNSPVLSTGNFQFNDPRGQVSSPALTDALLTFLSAEGCDVLHVHALEGYPLDLVARARGAGFPVVVTPHNYFALCPQVDLLHREREVCVDYDGGRRCVGCLRMPDPGAEMRRRAKLNSARRLMGDGLAGVAKAVGRSLRAWTRASSSGIGLDGARPGPEDDQPERAILAGEGVHLRVLNEYGERRRAGVDALRGADLVLPPGPFLLRVHEAMGVGRDKLRLCPLGLPHLDALRRATRAGPDAAPWRPEGDGPLRLTYFGNCWANKGLAVLVGAIEVLGPSDRFAVEVHASGDDSPFRARLRGFSQVTFHGAYDAPRQAAALEHAHASVLAGLGLENSPLVILEALAAGRFVIASDRGAVPDFVRDGVNGLLFRAGDPVALARAIQTVLDGRVALPRRHAVLESSPSTTFEQFVGAVVDAYARLPAARA